MPAKYSSLTLGRFICVSTGTSQLWKQQCENGKEFATIARDSAAASALDAKAAVDTVEQKMTEIVVSVQAAKTSENNAKISETNANVSAAVLASCTYNFTASASSLATSAAV